MDSLAAANASAEVAARRDNARKWLKKISTRSRLWGPENARSRAKWSSDRSHLPPEYSFIQN